MTLLCAVDYSILCVSYFSGFVSLATDGEEELQDSSVSQLEARFQRLPVHVPYDHCKSTLLGRGDSCEDETVSSVYYVVMRSF